MKGNLLLRKPLEINGKLHRELSYDANEITGEQFIAAEGRAIEYMGQGRVGAVEMDAGHQLYIGYYAIIAANPEIDIKDLERIKGADIVAIMRIGRNFTVSSSEEPSESNSSEECTETIAESIKPQQPSSEDGESENS